MTLRQALFCLVPVLALACGQEITMEPVDEPGLDQAAPDVVDGAAAADDAAADDAAADDAAAHPVEVAVFSVPGLDQATAASLAAALDGHEGVVKAMPLLDEGRFHVVFAPPASTPKTLLPLLQSVVEGTEFVEVRAAGPGAGPAHGDCGGCPKKNECDGH